MGDGLPKNWRTSSYSNGGGQCVEVGGLPGGAAVRDSKDRAAGHLSFDRPQWTVFLAAVARGRYRR
ncbi:DUF397 domain-containing protein [Saccharopolyspora sp. NPDC047091]|uniref:DUF397 domain-containing protein n=1 Tax=Saccharopolyspora sp. NPDC047091 TaxID=3155924 RepID=UPI0033E89237